MLPSLTIECAHAPTAETLRRWAEKTGHTTTQPAIWSLELGESFHTLRTGEETLFTVPSPLSLQQLTAHLEQAARNWQWRSRPLSCGWEFEPRTRQLTHAEHASIELTDKEAALLSAFLASPSAPLSRDSLLQDIWSYDPSIDSHTLETHLSRLRGKCESLSGLTLEIRAENEGYTLLGLA